MNSVEIESGLCQMCQRHPTEYADLVCGLCKEAVDRGDDWTLTYPDVLLALQERESEEEVREQ